MAERAGARNAHLRGKRLPRPHRATLRGACNARLGIDAAGLDQMLNRRARNMKKGKELPQNMELGETENEQTAKKIAGFLSRHAVPGLDLVDGAACLQNDIDSYISVLRSFVKYTPRKIHSTRTAGSDLKLYRAAVHGLKGSSKTIGATQLGEMAEKLEKAAASGNQSYIRANNSAFINSAEKLVADIAILLDAVSPGDPCDGKPKKDFPDPEVLREMLQACEDYDMPALQKAIGNLASFSYASDPNLVQWVTEQSRLSNFGAIQTRISSLTKISTGCIAK